MFVFDNLRLFKILRSIDDDKFIFAYCKGSRVFTYNTGHLHYIKVTLNPPNVKYMFSTSSVQHDKRNTTGSYYRRNKKAECRLYSGCTKQTKVNKLYI